VPGSGECRGDTHPNRKQRGRESKAKCLGLVSEPHSPLVPAYAYGALEKIRRPYFTPPPIYDRSPAGEGRVAQEHPPVRPGFQAHNDLVRAVRVDDSSTRWLHSIISCFA